MTKKEYISILFSPNDKSATYENPPDFCVLQLYCMFLHNSYSQYDPRWNHANNLVKGRCDIDTERKLHTLVVKYIVEQKTVCNFFHKNNFLHKHNFWQKNNFWQKKNNFWQKKSCQQTFRPDISISRSISILFKYTLKSGPTWGHFGPRQGPYDFYQWSDFL